MYIMNILGNISKLGLDRLGLDKYYNTKDKQKKKEDVFALQKKKILD